MLGSRAGLTQVLKIILQNHDSFSHEKFRSTQKAEEGTERLQEVTFYLFFFLIDFVFPTVHLD